jgi:hypothetical protein
MNSMQHITNSTGTADGVVHLMLTVGDAGMQPSDPERLMEEVWARATQIGPVLESILQDPHGQPRWGLNE